MPGVTRQIDPATRDYVVDTARGTIATTRNASTAIYHQCRTRLGQWWGDPAAGSRFHELERAKSVARTPRVVEDIASEALAPLVAEGRISEPELVAERQVDRVNMSLMTTDLQSGEELEITGLLPVLL